MKRKALSNRQVLLLATLCDSKVRSELGDPFSNLLLKNMPELKRAQNIIDEKRVVVMLLNKGVGVKQNGVVTHYELCAYPVRKETTGTDAEFAEKVKKVQAIRQDCTEALEELMNECSGVMLKGVLTQKDFDHFVQVINTIDIVDLKECINIIPNPKQDKS